MHNYRTTSTPTQGWDRRTKEHENVFFVSCKVLEKGIRINTLKTPVREFWYNVEHYFFKPPNSPDRCTMKSKNIHLIPPKLNLDFTDSRFTGHGGCVFLAGMTKRSNPMRFPVDFRKSLPHLVTPAISNLAVN